MMVLQRTEKINMRVNHSFFVTASGVLLSLSAFLSDAVAQDSALAQALDRSSSSDRGDGRESSDSTPSVPVGTMMPGATPMTASVESVSGKARWRSNAEAPWQEVKVKDVIAAGSEMRTGLRSNITLRFANAIVFIDSNSNFAIPAIEQGADTYHTLAQLKSGRADFTVNKIGLSNDFKVVTPTTTLAVKGTGFSVATGAMTGTEVVGVRTNVMAAIELKYAATGQTVQMSGGGGESKSSSSSPDPAKSALLATIGPPPSAGTFTSSGERESSASMGTTQSVSQTQVTNTTAWVAAVTADVAAAASGDDADGGNGNSLIALIADLTRVARSLDASDFGVVGAFDGMTNAVAALSAAHSALSSAQNHQANFVVAQQATAALAAQVSQGLQTVSDARAAAGEERSSAIENARKAFMIFASSLPGQSQTSGSDGPQGGSGAPSTIAEFVAAAQQDAADARSHASAAGEFASAASADETGARAAFGVAAMAAADGEAQATVATNASLASSAAATTAQEFQQIVALAREEIAVILLRRPLPSIASSLADALLNLESAVASLEHARLARDSALAAALEAHAVAATSVLSAVQASASAAAADALAAAQIAHDADGAAATAESGVGKLTLAIDAMLAARTAQEESQANALAASAAREIAAAQTSLALGQIGAHQGALDIAHGAQLAAAGSLVEALAHLNQAIVFGGFTTAQLQECLARLEAGDLQGAHDAAQSADSFAIKTEDESDATALSAAEGSEHASNAEAQVETSVAAGEFYNADNSTGWRSQVLHAEGNAIVAQGAASANAAQSAARAMIASLHGSAFALQFEGSEAATAALDAVAHALALAAQAAGNANATADALGAIRDALQVAQTAGAQIHFADTGMAASLARSNAADAQLAALDAREIADRAIAEAATAQSAVGSIGQAQLAQNSANVVDQHAVTLQGIDTQVTAALAVQATALADARASEFAAEGERATAISQFSESGARRDSVLMALTDMLGSMSQFDAARALEFAEVASTQAGLASDASAQAAGASARAALHDPVAANAAALSSTQEEIVRQGFDLATPILPQMAGSAGDASQHAVQAQADAIAAAGFAGIAGTVETNELAQLAAQRSAAAIERASAAVALSQFAHTRAQELLSAAMGAGFGEAQSAAMGAHGAALGAQGAASDAQSIAASAMLHAQLAHSSARAFGAGAVADERRMAAEFAAVSARNEQGIAGGAIAQHNAALASVSSLHQDAGFTMVNAQNQMNVAVDEQGAAHGYYVLAQEAALIEDYRAINGNAEHADSHAILSAVASELSTTHAAETRTHANAALLLVPQSVNAQAAYTAAVGSADGFAQAAQDARLATAVAREQSETFSLAAQTFSSQIASAQATTAANFAAAAHAHAIEQLSLAVQAQTDAYAAANSARSMGERVFFTRTAEIAGATVLRAGQAEEFARLARVASDAARADTNAAFALLPEGWEGQQQPPQ